MTMLKTHSMTISVLI